MGNLKITSHYPHSDKWGYETLLERVNLDEERIKDLSTGNGFIVSAPKAVKDDLKDPNGIFSTRYGQTLQDVTPYANRYKCKCGHLQSRFYKGRICEICGTEVKYVDDNFGYFGWIVLKDEYHIIHPNLFKSIAFFIGSTEFNNIVCPVNKKNQDGIEVEYKKPKDEPYYGLGMIGFYDKFDEIMDFYLQKNPSKSSYYDDIMLNRSKVFTQSIPVYTTHLRPFKLDGGMFNFEGTNALYNIMSKLVSVINNDQLKIFRKKKPKDQLLYDLQCKFNELYDELILIISGKKGIIRTTFGGRMNFTSRSVITPDPDLRIDEVKLPYQGLVGLLQQVIINILQKTYNYTPDKAYKFLTITSMTEENPVIVNIINGLIKDSGRGIPVLINRNPTISYGSIIQMYCTGISTGYTLNMPLQVLQGLGADFDGDTLNILYIINKDFLEMAENIFNPRNAMYISNNDGMFDNRYSHQRDTLININTMMQLSRGKYTPEQIALIKELQRGS